MVLRQSSVVRPCDKRQRIGNHFEQQTVGSVVSTVKTYFAGGVRVAMRTQTDASDVLHWLMSDALGSTTTATDANGGLVASAFYEAWGERTPVVGDLTTARRFTGQTHDPVIAGIYYYGARYYDPALGRFLQADTIVPNPGNPQSLNRYSNVLNNPLRFVDPSGHAGVDFWGGGGDAGAGIGLVVALMQGAQQTMAQAQGAVYQYGPVAQPKLPEKIEAREAGVIP